ncbi:MAG: hypothetical protein IKB82_01855 [Clostridia bacterium]|nr:hypothetical protein [Clostridia bacterium]
MYGKEHSFGELVRQYIESNSLSYQDLVEHLGYKSKTSVSRIIQDATSYQLRAQFYKQFRDQYPLTDAEMDAFETALNASRLSAEHQALFSAYRRLFSPASNAPASEPVVEYAESGRTCTLSEAILTAGQNAYNIDVLIFGMCAPATLRTLYQQLDGMSSSFTIRHCLFSQEDASIYIHLLNAVSDFLFDPRYILYHCDKRPTLVYTDNQLILHCDTEDGESIATLFLQSDTGRLFCSEPIGGELLQVYLNFFERNAEIFTPLKMRRRCRSEEEQILAFLQTQRQYASLEKGRSIYCYRKSLGLEFVPPEIYKDALLLNRFPDKAALSMVNDLVEAQRRRFQNIRSKKAPSYFMLSQDAIQNFIWTGRLRNHPFLLRPLSPRERMLVIRNLISLMEENPFFFLRFAAEDAPGFWDTASVSCYQQIQSTSSHKTVRDESLCFIPANETSDEYTTLQLVNPDVASSFAIFYREELWQKHTLSTKKSEHFVHMMLQYLSSRSTT